MGENERIIGSCLEINSDIIRMKFEDTKLPKVFINLREKYYRYKLVKSVKKLSKANVPLNKTNLLELFSYLYSNFPPYGSYKKIKQIMHIDKNNLNIWKTVIRYSEDVVVSIDIDNSEDKMTITTVINDPKTDQRTTYTDYISELKTDKNATKNIIEGLNKSLIETIMDYILSVIDSTKNIERKV